MISHEVARTPLNITRESQRVHRRASCGKSWLLEEWHFQHGRHTHRAISPPRSMNARGNTHSHSTSTSSAAMTEGAEGRGQRRRSSSHRTSDLQQRDEAVKDEWGDPGKILPSLPLPESPPNADKVRHSPDRTHGGAVPLPARR